MKYSIADLIKYKNPEAIKSEVIYQLAHNRKSKVIAKELNVPIKTINKIRKTCFVQ